MRWFSHLLIGVLLSTSIGPQVAPAQPQDTTDDAQALRVTAPPAAVRRKLELGPFYKKYFDAGGFAVLGSNEPSDYAFYEAAYLIDRMLAGRPDVLQAMIDNNTRLVIMSVTEMTSDVPEHSVLKPAAFWDKRARGLGGSDRDPVASCGEENLLALEGDPYGTESIMIHEFAHSIHLRGINVVDPTFNDRLRAAYSDAMRRGLWQGKYAANNPDEYFAEAVQSWFDTNREPDHDHNHVNTREELREYDPAVAALVAEVFGDGPWRYVPPTRRSEPGHLAGFDRGKAPRFAWPVQVVAAFEQHQADQKQRQDKRKDDATLSDPHE